MALLAPYHQSMKLGSGMSPKATANATLTSWDLTGFNSFTQELCLEGAVTREDGSKGIEAAPESKEAPVRVAQQVTYKTSIIDKVSDVFDTLNVRQIASTLTESR